MKILSSLLGLILLGLAVSFALSNRQTAEINLWPFDIVVTAPLYLMTLGMLGMGLTLGAFITWLSLLPHRFIARRLHADMASLHEKIDNLELSLSTRRDLRLPGLEPLHRRLWDKARNFGRSRGKDFEI